MPFDALLSARRRRGFSEAEFPQLAGQHRCSSGYTKWPNGAAVIMRQRRRATAELPLAPWPGVAGSKGLLLALLHHYAEHSQALPPHAEVAAQLGGYWTEVSVNRGLAGLEDDGLIVRHIHPRNRAVRAIDLILLETTLRSAAALAEGFE